VKKYFPNYPVLIILTSVVLLNSKYIVKLLSTVALDASYKVADIKKDIGFEVLLSPVNSV
jgi:hypothetical protein